MAKLLFSLRNVPNDEAQKIRDLLNEEDFDWYETSGGNWGISMPAFWLRDDTQWEAARASLDAFQEQLSSEVRQEYENRKQAGESETFTSLFLRNPALFLLALGGIAVIVYFSIAPFLGLV